MSHHHLALRDELVEAAVGGVFEFGSAPESFGKIAAGLGERFFICTLQSDQHQSRYQPVAQLRNQQALLGGGRWRQERREITLDANRPGA